jgi:hypothetical protein
MNRAERWTSWRKSTFSNGTAQGDCVEIAWRKSSFSDGGNGDCVEIGFIVEAVGVRDSKNSGGPHLEFPHPHWHLLAGLES